MPNLFRHPLKVSSAPLEKELKANEEMPKQVRHDASNESFA
jgi:hypothetical protein